MVASVALRSAPRATRSRLIASSARRPSDSRGTYAFFSGGRSSQHFGSWNCPRKSSSASGDGNERPSSFSSPLSSASTRTSSTRFPAGRDQGHERLELLLRGEATLSFRRWQLRPRHFLQTER